MTDEQIVRDGIEVPKSHLATGMVQMRHDEAHAALSRILAQLQAAQERLTELGKDFDEAMEHGSELGSQLQAAQEARGSKLVPCRNDHAPKGEDGEHEPASYCAGCLYELSAEVERLRGECCHTFVDCRHRPGKPLHRAPEGTQVIGPMHPYPKEDTGMATRLPAPEGTQDD